MYLFYCNLSVKLLRKDSCDLFGYGCLHLRKLNDQDAGKCCSCQGDERKPKYFKSFSDKRSI